MLNSFKLQVLSLSYYKSLYFWAYKLSLGIKKIFCLLVGFFNVSPNAIASAMVAPTKSKPMNAERTSLEEILSKLQNIFFLSFSWSTLLRNGDEGRI